jgi:hypothetical protein
MHRKTSAVEGDVMLNLKRRRVYSFFVIRIGMTVTIALTVGLVETAWAQESCNGREATLVGTEGDDLLLGGPDDDVIVGLGGNDVIRGRDGIDFICGGSGNDDARTNDGIGYLAGGSGDDVLLGGPQDDQATTI